jgi:hypothetical protein
VDKLKPNELNGLIDEYLRKHKITASDAINSITAYNQSIYISFKSESSAREAASYFAQVIFKASKLDSLYLDNHLDPNIRRRQNSSQANSKGDLNEPDEWTNEQDTVLRSKRYRAVGSDCELLVANRQLK